jgi:hypothetical protein
MAARASADRRLGRLASRRTTDRGETESECLMTRARENPLIYETSYSVGSLFFYFSTILDGPRLAHFKI